MFNDKVKEMARQVNATQLSSLTAARLPAYRTAAAQSSAPSIKRFTPSASRVDGGRFSFSPTAQASPVTAQRRKQWAPVPAEEDKPWYRGEQPTLGETMARINTLYGADQPRAAEMYGSVMAMAADPTTPVYSPYLQATNPAIANLEALGYDVSGGIDRDWIERNRGLIGGYRVGTSGTPLAPASTSTPENDAGYWYYKVTEAEETTQKAEAEWAALQEELAYWATRSDRNYSDEEIMARIDWSAYPTLTRMDEGRQQGVPLTLNRPVGYSTDAMYGTLWAARNGGGSGNPLNDSLSYYGGQGTSWQENAEITARLDPTSDSYCPYAVGCTLDDEALYFGVPSFGKDWLDANRGILSGNDETARRMYGRVYDAEQLTLKAEAEWAALQAEAARLMRYSSNPATVMQAIDWDDYPTLSRMEASLQSGEIMGLTRAVPFNRADFVRGLVRECVARSDNTGSMSYFDRMSYMFGAEFGSKPTHPAVQIITGETEATRSTQPVDDPGRHPAVELVVGPRSDDDDEPAAPTHQPIPTGAIALPGSDAAALAETPKVASAAATPTPSPAASVGNTGPAGLTESVSPYAQASIVLNMDPAAAVRTMHEQQLADEAVFGSHAIEKASSDTSAMAIASTRRQRLNELGAVIANQGTSQEGLAWRTGFQAAEMVASLGNRVAGNKVSPAGYFAHRVARQNQLLTENPVAFMDAYAVVVKHDQLESTVAQHQEILHRYTPVLMELTPTARPDLYDETGAPLPLDTAGTNPDDLVRLHEALDAISTSNIAQTEARTALRDLEASEGYQYALGIVDQYGASPEQVQLMERFTRYSGLPFQTISILPALQVASGYSGYTPPSPMGWSEFELYEMAGTPYAEVAAYARQCDAAYEQEIAALDYIIGVLEQTWPEGFDTGNAQIDVRTPTDLAPAVVSNSYLDGLRARREYLMGQREDIRYFLLREDPAFLAWAAQPNLERYDPYLGDINGYLGPGGISDNWYHTMLQNGIVLNDAPANGGGYKPVSSIRSGTTTLDLSAADPNTTVLITSYGERLVYAYLRATQGQEAADAFRGRMGSTMSGRLAYRLDAEQDQLAYDFAQEHPFLGAMQSSVTNMLGGIVGTGYTAWTQASGSEINPHHWAFDLGQSGAGTRSGARDHFTELVGGADTALGKVVGFIYDGATTAMDSAVNAAVFGKVGTVSLGLSGFSSTVRDAKLRGATDGQALALGAVTFVAETATEALVQYDFQKAVAAGKTRTFRGFLAAVGLDSFFEGLGEGMSEAITAGADTLIMGESSNYALAVKAYEAAGKTPGQAQRDALRDVMWDVAYAYLLGSAVSVASHGVGYVAGRLLPSQMPQGDMNDLTARVGILVEALGQADPATQTIAVASAISVPTEASAPQTQVGHTLRTPVTADDGAATAEEPTATPAKEGHTLRAPATADDGEVTAPAPALTDPVAEANLAVADYLTGLTGSTEKATALTANLIMLANQTGTGVATLNRALSTAYAEGTLGSSTNTAHNLLSEMASGNVNSISADDFGAFIAAAESERGSLPGLMNHFVQQGAEMQIARRVQQKVAGGALDGLATARTAVEKAQADVELATRNLQVAQQQLTATQANLSTLSEQHLADPMNQMTRGALQQSIKDLEGDTIVVQQSTQALEQRQADLNRANTALSDQTEQGLSRLRQEAAAEVAAEAEALATAQAEAEAAEAVRAEEQRQQDNVTAVETEAFLAKIEKDYPGLTDEQRGQLREQYANMLSGQQDTTPATPDRSGVPQSTLKLMSRLSHLYGVRFKVTDGVRDGLQYRGAYQSDGTILVSRNATQDEVLRRTLIHELTHRAETGDAYGDFAQELLGIVYGDNRQQLQADLDAIAARYRRALGTGYKDSIAFSELVAAKAEDILGNADVINRLAAEKPSIAARIWQTLKDFVKRIVGVKSPEADRIRKAEELYRKALEQAREKASQQRSGLEGHHPMTTQFSITQLADSLGLKVDEITVGDEALPYRLVDRNGNPVTKITAEDIDKTYLGRLIRVAETARTITSETATAQRELFAELATLVATCQDGAMIWEMVGAEFFSAVKNNSDKQYGKTVDFGTVCVKTKALVDVLSETMVRLGRGLTRDEVLQAYAETAKADLSVPCAPCYVFSRWIGVPSLLNNMKAYQQRFEGWTAEQVTSYVDSAISKYSSPDGKGSASSQINKKKASIEKRLATATDKLTKLYEASRNRELTTKQQAALDKQRRLVDSLESQLAEIDAYNWVTQVLCSFHTENGAVIVDRDANGNVVLNPEYKAVPDDVLFDLRTGAKFATEYPWAWRYRTTRGAGMGKAILPYSGFTLGDVIYSTQRRTAAEENIFLSDEADVDSLLRKLQNRVKTMRAQNLIGGFRWQSTSDFRPEWGLDYIMTMLEMQACGAKGQLYTKIIEAAEMFATAGIETNLSLIAKGKGYHLDENGRPVIGLEDLSSVSGIDAAAAFELIKRHDNAQVILVGLSPEHIRAAMADSRIGFIIPWHASGSSDQIQLVLLSAIGESPSDAVDFTDVQNDSPLKNRTVLQKQTADIRTRLLTGKLLKDGVLITTDAELEIINGNEFLKSLYERFYLDSSATETYHAWLSSEQASGIFPYEYWDTSLGLKDADENGKRFVRYCESLGLQPRFSEFKTDPGYWKLLIDRRMYNRDGTYHHPQTVDVTKIKTSDIPLSVSAVRYDNDAAVEQAVLNTIDRVTGRLPSPDFAANQMITGSVSDFVQGQVAQMRETAQGGVQFALEPYSEHQIQNWAGSKSIVVCQGTDHCREFAEAALRGEDLEKKLYFGMVSEELAERVRTITGVDISNYNFTLRASEIRKIIGKHGAGNEQDPTQRGIEIDDFAQLPDILTDPDDIRLSPRLYEGKPVIVFVKTINGRTTVVSYASKKHHDLVVQTMYASKQKENLATAADAEAPAVTPEAHVGTVLSTSIPNSLKNVNPDTKFADPAPLLPSPEILDAEMAAFHDRMSGPPSTPDSATPGPESFNNPGERQFNAKQAPRSQALPDWLKRELWKDRWYEKDTNRAQAERAWNRIASEGYDAARERLLNLNDWGTDENVEALIMMHMALRSVDQGGMADPEFAMEVSLRYGEEGTKQGQALQARKLFQRLTPIGMRIWATSSAEAALRRYTDAHLPAVKAAKKRADQVKAQIEDRDGTDPLAPDTNGDIVITPESTSRWGVPLNERQQALIDHYRLNNVARPGLFYNRATTKQRMLEAILATPDPTAPTGLGLSLIDRLELIEQGAPVALETDLDYITDQMQEYVNTNPDGYVEFENRLGDLALARAYEAYGNITPATAREKGRAWRYTSMLLSIPSAARNVIGNTAQNAANLVAHDVAVLLDKLVSGSTGERTMAINTMQERAAGWRAFVNETVDTYRDVFVDKASTRRGNDRFNMHQRGRVFQSAIPEGMRQLEGFLMSVGDRNVWRKTYVQSLAEQARVAEMNGVEFDQETAAERAIQEANFATFSEDNSWADAISRLKNTKYGWVLDFIIPFHGVPLNITKRMGQFSPFGLALSVGHAIYRAITKQTFDQYGFVNSIARGLTGSAMFAAGMLLYSLGAIKLGTGKEEDKEYQLHTAMGQQYSPYIQIGGQNVSLSVLAPAISPVIMGATMLKLVEDAGEGELGNALLSAAVAAGDQIFDASFMSNLSDILGGYGSPTENIITTIGGGMISQNIPSILGQLASALDPYVRDTRDKDMLMQILNSGLINKLPWLREMLPAKVDVAGRRVENTDQGILAFIDPFNRTTIHNDPALVEIDRLHTVLGTSSHMPSDALSGSRDSLTGVSAPVTGKDKEEYKVRYGELWLNGGTTYDSEGNRVVLMGVNDLIETSWYRRMTDAEKAEAIAGVIAAARTGAAYEIGEALGHKPKTSSSLPSASAIKGVPAQLQGRYPELDKLFAATGDGTFLPKGIGRIFDRNKVRYSLNDRSYAVLWDMYLTELDRLMVKIDFSDDPETVAAAVASVYSTAASRAKDAFVDLYPDGRVR